MPEFGCPNREFRMNPNFRAQDLTPPMTPRVQSVIHLAYV